MLCVALPIELAFVLAHRRAPLWLHLGAISFRSVRSLQSAVAVSKRAGNAGHAGRGRTRTFSARNIICGCAILMAASGGLLLLQGRVLAVEIGWMPFLGPPLLAEVRRGLLLPAHS